MKTWNVHWCESSNLFGGCIKVDAPNKREAENIAFSQLLKKPYNFVILSVQESVSPSIQIPPGCHCWGRQIRNNTEWRKKW